MGVPGVAADTVSDTINALVSCVCSALETADRPVCSCGLTVGPPVVGLEQCCECETGAGGQVAGFLERVYPADGQTLEQVTRLENCRPGAVAADFSIVVTRCYPRIDTTGHMPDLDTTTPVAEDLHTDIQTAWNALACCGTNVVIRESAVDADPEGGCSAFAIRVTALVAIPANQVVGS